MFSKSLINYSGPDLKSANLETQFTLQNESLNADHFSIYGDGDNFINITERRTKKQAEGRPSARYGHAACSCSGGFVIYGGKLANGDLSDELWYYNVSARKWFLRATVSEFRPPKLTRHTLTLVENDVIYLFGGSTVGGEFSSKLYFIKLNFCMCLLIFF